MMTRVEAAAGWVRAAEKALTHPIPKAHLRYGVVTPGTPGMAAQQAPGGQSEAGDGTVLADCLNRVGRTGREVATTRRQQRGKAQAINLHEADHYRPKPSSRQRHQPVQHA